MAPSKERVVGRPRVEVFGFARASVPPELVKTRVAGPTPEVLSQKVLFGGLRI